jgi:hypothetical protein
MGLGIILGIASKIFWLAAGRWTGMDKMDELGILLF